ncbi:MAG: hypothetical protein B7733_13940 [Myxococcales bacterium FL481]|nr:MAG: hypothetical protein B7733_13940 [Myxococcales bacterium FL481]
MIALTTMAAALWCGGLTASVPPADGVETRALASTATGLSLAGAGGRTLRRRSPLHLNVGAGFRHPQWPALELAAGLQAELEDRVSVALRPTLRAFLPRRGTQLYGLAGGVFYVVPFTLHGVEAGFGVAYPVGRSVALTGELTATTFIGGNDLMMGSSLAKIDLAVGARLAF